MGDQTVGHCGYFEKMDIFWKKWIFSKNQLLLSVIPREMVKMDIPEKSEYFRAHIPLIDSRFLKDFRTAKILQLIGIGQ